MLYSNPILPGFYPDPSVCRAASRKRVEIGW